MGKNLLTKFIHKIQENLPQSFDILVEACTITDGLNTPIPTNYVQEKCFCWSVEWIDYFHLLFCQREVGQRHIFFL